MLNDFKRPSEYFAAFDSISLERGRNEIKFLTVKSVGSLLNFLITKLDGNTPKGISSQHRTIRILVLYFFIAASKNIGPIGRLSSLDPS